MTGISGDITKDYIKPETKAEAEKAIKMHCRQCEYAPQGGCTQVGICGKDPVIASLQDTIIIGLKGVAAYAVHARELGHVA